MRFLASLLFLVLASGCYDSHGTGSRPFPPLPVDDAGRPDAPTMPPPPMPPPPMPPPPGEGGAYVIHVLEIPEPAGGRAPGANLDGLDSGEGSVSPSATCEEFNQDFDSLHDGSPGVDDAYGQLVPTIEGLLEPGDTIRGRIADAIASGELLMVLEVFGAGATLHFVTPLGPLEIDRTGRLAPGQRFASIEVVAAGMGTVSGGRTRLSMGDFALPFGDDLIPLLPFGHLSSVEMRFDATPEGLRRGVIGGSVTVEEGVAAGERLMPGIGDTVRGVLEAVADLDPSASDPAICERVSVGMTFEAVPAELVEP